MYALGEILPVRATTGPNASLVVQFAALKSGQTAGGNFEYFQDLASLGWVPDTPEGYGTYLAYNTLGMGDPAYDNLPEFAGWQLGATGAYAIVHQQHQGSNVSPLWDVPSWTAHALSSLLGLVGAHRWTAGQRAQAEQAFALHFPRLLTKWGYRGAVTSVAVPVMVEHPYFKAIGRGPVWVDKSTITYDGPDPDPTQTGGRMFTAGGNTWRWGGTPIPSAQPTTTSLAILVDGTDVRYDARSVTLYRTKGWFLIARSASQETRTPVTKWDGEYLNWGDAGPRGMLLLLHDVSPSERVAVANLTGPNIPPDQAIWGWGRPVSAALPNVPIATDPNFTLFNQPLPGGLPGLPGPTSLPIGPVVPQVGPGPIGPQGPSQPILPPSIPVSLPSQPVSAEPTGLEPTQAGIGGTLLWLVVIGALVGMMGKPARAR